MTIRSLYITITLLLLMAALSFFMTACTAEGIITSQERGTSLIVSVSTEGFTSTDSDTRTTDKQYTTAFANGDQIGIFAVSGNMVLDANIPYQYNGTAWTPVNTDNTIHHYHYAGVTYFAYYPYSQAMDNAVNEAGIISSFTPQTDQGTQAAYSASNLMTGKGTIADENLNISLSHQMSLIIVRPEGDRYTAGDYEFRSSYATITTQQAGNVTAGYEAGDGMLRFLVSPGASINVAITYTTAEGATASYNTTLSTPATGKYYRYNLSTGGTGTHTTAVGDYYMANGSIVPKSRSLSDSQKKNCMGVIFSLTTSDTDKGYGWTHGYVIDKEHIPNKGGFGQYWGPMDIDEPGLDYKATRDAARSNKDGYTETEAILTAHHADTQYGVWMQLQEYRKENPVPADVKRSPWYIPSCGQWYDILVNLGGETGIESYNNERESWTTKGMAGRIFVYNAITAALKNAGGNFNWAQTTYSSWIYIWCSSEHDATAAWDIRFDNGGNVYLDYAPKNDISRRLGHAVLAF